MFGRFVGLDVIRSAVVLGTDLVTGDVHIARCPAKGEGDSPPSNSPPNEGRYQTLPRLSTSPTSTITP